MACGMNHEFLLVKQAEVTDDIEKYSRQGRVLLHDDFLTYVMRSSLKWIPTKDPFTGAENTGLNAYGLTVIEQKGAETAKKVFSAWRDLVSAGPDVLSFYCGDSWKDGEAVPFIARFNKSELLGNLNRIINYLEQINEDVSVVHFGI